MPQPKLCDEKMAHIRREAELGQEHLLRWADEQTGPELWTFTLVVAAMTKRVGDDPVTQLIAFFAMYGLCRTLESMKDKDASATDAKR